MQWINVLGKPAVYEFPRNQKRSALLLAQRNLLGVAPVDQPATRPASLTMKVRELIRLLEADGWYLARTRGSHHQYKHPTKPGLVTVPGSGNDDLALGTLNSILKHAGLKPWRRP